MKAHHFAPRTIQNPIIKDQATFLETAAETEGQRSLIRVEMAPNGGNELHYHKNFDETFIVQSGVLGIQTGKQTLLLEEGQSATAYSGEAHRFFNPSGTKKVTFDVSINPGFSNFETTLQVAYGLAGDGLTTPNGIPINPYYLGLLYYWGDTNLAGLYSISEPILLWFAKKALQKGMDKTLKERYCIL